ncbi:MAG: TlpA disulfide reductase family protein [Salinivirgaceae bacterium]
MSTFLKIGFVFVFVAFGICTHSQTVYEHQYLVRVGDMAPDFTIRETNGDTYKLSDLRGHVVMLQFTASWCGVCRREMPHIEQEVWKPGKAMGLKVIGIDRDEPLDKVIDFKNQVGVTYPLALDLNADIFGKFALKQAGVTRNVVIDREGRIIFLTRLFRMDEFNEMKTAIFKELKRK